MRTGLEFRGGRPLHRTARCTDRRVVSCVLPWYSVAVRCGVVWGVGGIRGTAAAAGLEQGLPGRAVGARQPAAVEAELPTAARQLGIPTIYILLTGSGWLMLGGWGYQSVPYCGRAQLAGWRLFYRLRPLMVGYADPYSACKTRLVRSSISRERHETSVLLSRLRPSRRR